MSELSFLIELLLNHDLPKSTKDLIASRIKEVEQNLVTYQQHKNNQLQPVSYIPPTLKQAPSTLAAMARHGDVPYIAPEIIAPVPVEVVAQTPQTAAAMNSRAEAIAASMAGKVDKITGRPKKW